jgi:hypothetical protein
MASPKRSKRSFNRTLSPRIDRRQWLFLRDTKKGAFTVRLLLISRLRLVKWHNLWAPALAQSQFALGWCCWPGTNVAGHSCFPTLSQHPDMFEPTSNAAPFMSVNPTLDRFEVFNVADGALATGRPHQRVVQPFQLYPL